MKKVLCVFLLMIIISNLFVGCDDSNVNMNTNDEKQNEISHTTDDENKISVGDIVAFGSFEQDGISENGKEKIEWLVLEQNSGNALMLSNKIIYENKFVDKASETSDDYIWANSSLRKWLNNEFLNESFNSEEIGYINTTTLTNSNNPLLQMNCGQQTEDKIFILSLEETVKYLKTDASRIAKPCEMLESDFNWYITIMRTPAYGPIGQNISYYNAYDGKLDYICGYVVDGEAYIRPAMWIKIDGNDSVKKVGESEHSNIIGKSSDETVYYNIRHDVSVAEICNNTQKFLNKEKHGNVSEIFAGLSGRKSFTFYNDDISVCCYIKSDADNAGVYKLSINIADTNLYNKMLNRETMYETLKIMAIPLLSVSEEKSTKDLVDKILSGEKTEDSYYPATVYTYSDDLWSFSLYSTRDNKIWINASHEYSANLEELFRNPK